MLNECPEGWGTGEGALPPGISIYKDNTTDQLPFTYLNYNNTFHQAYRKCEINKNCGSGHHTWPHLHMTCEGGTFVHITS